MKWVIDASVAAKWLAPEPDSALAEALLDDDLIVPDSLYAEVGHILWKKQMRGEMEAPTVQVGARWLLQVPMWVHDSASLLADTLGLALQLQQPAYACFYLALARRADVQLITADRRFHARCHASDAAGLGQWVRMLDAQRVCRNYRARHTASTDFLQGVSLCCGVARPQRPCSASKPPSHPASHPGSAHQCGHCAP